MALELYVDQFYHIGLCEIINGDITDHQSGKLHLFSILEGKDPMNIYLVIQQVLMAPLLFLGLLLFWRAGICWRKGFLRRISIRGGSLVPF